MLYSGSFNWVYCLLVAAFIFHTPVKGQCEFLNSDIEHVRSEAMHVLRISDTLEIFIAGVRDGSSYRHARSSSRRAQIYSGEILAAAYRITTRAGLARQRALNCNLEGAAAYLAKADTYALKAREQADQAFVFAKKAYASRNMSTIRRYLNQSLLAAQQARKAAVLVAEEASGAHFCCSGTEIVTAGGQE